MNIQVSSSPSLVRSQPALVEKKAVAQETPEVEEPKDGFSLTRTLSSGLLTFMGRRIPSTLPEISAEKIEDLKSKVKPGDVLMSADLSYPGWGRMEYWAIGSHYTHAALAGSDGLVYEAVGEGVITSTVEEFLEGRKKIAIARPGLNAEEAKEATEYAKSQLGKPYDGVFNYGDDSEFYCSELVAKALKQGKGDVDIPMGTIFGKEAVSPDIWRKTPGVEVIHDDGSSYWGNKVHYWPTLATTAVAGVVGHMLGGIGGAVLGAGAGMLGSILVGNKIQTGQFSPTLVELTAGKH